MYISVKQYLSPVKRGKRDIFRIRANFFENLLCERVFSQHFINISHVILKATIGGRYYY